jgi:hypothetical protein
LFNKCPILEHCAPAAAMQHAGPAFEKSPMKSKFASAFAGDGTRLDNKGAPAREICKLY